MRVTFSRGEDLKYISHLDLMRLWQRALRRAGVPVAYSEGFSPHPRLSLACPLQVGVTSEAELMDVFLKRRLAPFFFIKALKGKLPRGVDVLGAEEVPLNLPSLQSSMHFAEYRVAIVTEKGPKDVLQAISSFLGRKELPWEHMRDKEARKYDLRALVDDLWPIGFQDSELTLGMRLRADATGTGRPEQVVAAMGLDEEPKSIHRAKLILSRDSKMVSKAKGGEQ